jgi:hypothetical protein
MKIKNKKEDAGKKNSFNEMLVLALLGFIVIFAVTLPINNLVAGFKLALAYFLFFYLPFIGFLVNLELSVIERFLLTNILGLSYSVIYVVLDVFLKIPMTKAVFLILTCAVAVLSVAFSLKQASAFSSD